MIENPNWQNIVNRLLEKRTQKELSKLTGITQSTISSLKNGVDKKRLSYVSGAALLRVLEQDKKEHSNE